MIKKTKILEGLSVFDISAIKKRHQPISFKKGDILFAKDADSDSVFIVESGRVYVSIKGKSEDRDIVIYTLTDGDIIGEMTLFLRGKRTATAIAISDLLLIKIPNDQFVEYIAKNPNLGINLIKIMTERLISANEMIERLGVMDAKSRIEDFLVSMVLLEGIDHGDHIVITRPTYFDIAHKLGLSERTVLRVLKSLAVSQDLKFMKKRELSINKKLINRYL